MIVDDHNKMELLVLLECIPKAQPAGLTHYSHQDRPIEIDLRTIKIDPGSHHNHVSF